MTKFEGGATVVSPNVNSNGVHQAPVRSFETSPVDNMRVETGRVASEQEHVSQDAIAEIEVRFQKKADQLQETVIDSVRKNGNTHEAWERLAKGDIRQKKDALEAEVVDSNNTRGEESPNKPVSEYILVEGDSITVHKQDATPESNETGIRAASEKVDANGIPKEVAQNPEYFELLEKEVDAARKRGEQFDPEKVAQRAYTRFKENRDDSRIPLDRIKMIEDRVERAEKQIEALSAGRGNETSAAEMAAVLYELLQKLKEEEAEEEKRKARLAMIQSLIAAVAYLIQSLFVDDKDQTKPKQEKPEAKHSNNPIDMLAYLAEKRKKEQEEVEIPSPGKKQIAPGSKTNTMV